MKLKHTIPFPFITCPEYMYGNLLDMNRGLLRIMDGHLVVKFPVMAADLIYLLFFRVSQICGQAMMLFLIILYSDTLSLFSKLRHLLVHINH